MRRSQLISLLVSLALAGLLVVAPAAQGELTKCSGDTSANNPNLKNTVFFPNGDFKATYDRPGATTISGRTTFLGNPAGPYYIDVYARPLSDPLAFSEVYVGSTATQGTDSHWSLDLPPGPSRLIRIYADEGPVNNPDLYGTTYACLYIRTGEIALEAFPGSLQNGHVTRFSGTVPGPVYESATVKLQVRVGKKWRTLKVLGTNDEGEFQAGYRFTQTRSTQTYKFRVVVPSQKAYPYVDVGLSRKVKVKVTP